MIMKTLRHRIYRRIEDQDTEIADGGDTLLRERESAFAKRRARAWVFHPADVRGHSPEGGTPEDEAKEGKTGDGEEGGDDGGAERRRFRRSRVLWGGTLRLVEDGSTLSVTLANISASGAKLMFTAMPGREEAEVIERLRPRLRVVLLLPDTAAIPSEVVWVGTSSLGITFLVEPEEAARRLGRVARLE